MRIAQIAPLHERVPPKFYGGTERVVSGPAIGGFGVTAGSTLKEAKGRVLGELGAATSAQEVIDPAQSCDPHSPWRIVILNPSPSLSIRLKIIRIMIGGPYEMTSHGTGLPPC
jgi:hypothetical protein